MALWSDLEKYLKGEHLRGKKPTVTIAEIAFEEMHATGKAEQKPVCYFREGKKGLVLSPTNQRTLRALFGDDIAGCINKRVQLEAIAMRVAGRDTLPVRINPAPQVPTTEGQPTRNPEPTIKPTNGTQAPDPNVSTAPSTQPSPNATDQASDTEFAALVSAQEERASR